MKALTIRQPWATLIALGVKTIETRSWRAPKALIGQRVAIHAGKALPPFGLQLGPWTIVDTPGRWVASDCDRGLVRDLPLGAVVAVATLADCVPMVGPEEVGPDGWPDDGPVFEVDGENLHLWPFNAASCDASDYGDQLPYGDFRPGRWAWMLTDIDQLLDPIPATGKQGVWEWKP